MWDQTVSPNPLYSGCLVLCLLKHEMLLFFSVWFFSGGRLCLFRGCVKVLSVLGWFIVTSLGGPNRVTQTSWSGIRSECYNSTKHCYFTARTGLRVTSFGRGCDRTVRRNLGISLGSGSALVSVCSFVRLFFFLSAFLSLFLSFFLSLSLSWLDLQDQAARCLTTT